MDFRPIAVAATAFACLAMFIPSAWAETWAGYNGGPEGNRVVGKYPGGALQTRWTGSPGLASSKASCVTYKGGTVFTSVTDPSTGLSRVVAVEAETGTSLWEGDDFLQIVGCPALAGDQVYFLGREIDTGRWLLAKIEAGNGSLIWVHEFRSADEVIGSSVAVGADRVVAFVMNAGQFPEHQVVGLDRASGDELWRKPGLYPPEADPVLHRGVVMVTLPRGGFPLPSGYREGVAAYRADDGTDLGWSITEQDEAAPGLAQGDLFLHVRRRARPGESEFVVARQIPSGEILWTHQLPETWPTVDRLVADAERVYVEAMYQGVPRIFAVDMEDGQETWGPVLTRHGGPGFIPTLIEGRLVTGAPSFGGKTLDPETGKETGIWPGFSGSGESTGLAAYGDRGVYYWRGSGNSWQLCGAGDTVAPELEIVAPRSGKFRSTEFEFAWTAADYFQWTSYAGAGIDRFELAVPGRPVIHIPGDQRSARVVGLPQGTNEVKLDAVDKVGNRSSKSLTLTVDSEPAPEVTLEADRSVVVTGQQFLLDASGSRDTVEDGAIAAYAWDLDGDGSFETAGDQDGMAHATLEKPGFFSVGVRVTNDSGGQSEARTTIEARPARLPGAGPVGISINDAAQFTNDPKVKIRISWPALAARGFASNKSDLVEAVPFSLTATGAFIWTLDKTGPDRWPKTVYVKFEGAGAEADQIVYQDDIILDQASPTVVSAGLVGAAAPAGMAPRQSMRGLSPLRRKERPAWYRIRVRARDANAGVVAIQAAWSLRRKGPVVEIGRRNRLVNSVAPSWTPYRPKLVRVKDAAGNWSRFKKVR